MKRLLEYIKIAANKFLFSDLCHFCRVNQKKAYLSICDDCFNRVRFISPPLCKICGKPFISRYDKDHTCGECLKTKRHFTSARSIFVYDDVIQSAIVSYKFFRDTTLAKVFSKYISYYIENELDGVYDLAIPVPLHKRRLKERYFNQALLLINDENNKIKVDKRSLKRIKYTKPQLLLKVKERIKNVRGAFEVTGAENIAGKDILLVDDIYTTGSTVNECSKTLKRAGAKKVDVLTLAKTVFG